MNEQMRMTASDQLLWTNLPRVEILTVVSHTTGDNLIGLDSYVWITRLMYETSEKHHGYTNPRMAGVSNLSSSSNHLIDVEYII